MSAIVTFYAPTGARSHASKVSAVARLLAERGLHVLAVDWNLGPRNHPGLTRSEHEDRPGLLDLLQARMEERPEPDWRGMLLTYDTPGVDLLPAGRLSSANAFSWSAFYETHAGGVYLERLREEWWASHDLVLIHCPAGADEEGVCTVQMADLLVLCFELDRAGVAAAVHSVWRRQEARQQLAYDRTPLLVLPVPVVASARPGDQDTGLNEAALWLAPCFSDWLPGTRAPREVLELLRLDPGTGHDESSCLLISKLLLGDFQNAAELIPASVPTARPAVSTPEQLARAPLADLLELDIPWPGIRAEGGRTAADTGQAAWVAEWEAWKSRQRRLHAEWQVEERRRALGEEHSDTLSAVENLASMLYALGDYRAALRYQERVLEVRRRVLGEEHPDTLSARTRLAATRYALGDYPGALQHEKQVLEVRRRVLGERHPDTLWALSNLASTLYALGDYPEARRCEEQVLRVRGWVLGEKHPDTLSALGNVASTIRALGDYPGALRLQYQVLEMSREVLGDEHPDTLLARGELASTLRTLGHYQDARQHEESVLDMSRQLLGEKHPATLTAMANLATTLGALGDYEGARQHEERVLEVRREVLGDEHPDTLSALGNLAATVYALNDPSTRQYEEWVLEARHRVLGDEHPDTLSALNNLAITLKTVGKPEEARRHAMRVLNVRQRVLGYGHPDTLSASLNLATTFRTRRDNLRFARETAEHVLEARRRVLGNQHPDTLSARLNLSAMLYALGDYKEAHVHAEWVLDESRRVLGEQHPLTLSARTHLEGMEPQPPPKPEDSLRDKLRKKAGRLKSG